MVLQSDERGTPRLFLRSVPTKVLGSRPRLTFLTIHAQADAAGTVEAHTGSTGGAQSICLTSVAPGRAGAEEQTSWLPASLQPWKGNQNDCRVLQTVVELAVPSAPPLLIHPKMLLLQRVCGSQVVAYAALMHQLSSANIGGEVFALPMQTR